jgi:hypothetical protein
MTTPPPPGGPYDPNQPYGGQQPGGYGAPAQDHPKGTTALVLGILGVVCCSFAAPFAWMTGKKAVTEIDASGGRLGGRGKAQAGYILGIIGTVLLVLGLLFFIFAAVTGGLSFEASTSTS